jgi:hypothetical protein
MIAEMLEDRLEEYIDVDVGNAKQVDPAFIVEEKFDCLIIGDVINDVIPSLEIQDWLLKYREISNDCNLKIKAVSGYYISLSDIKIKPLWIESLQENINTEIMFPPILSLKLKRADLTLEDGALETVKDYSNDFIEFLLSYKKKE